MRAPHLFLAAAVAGLLGTSSTPAWSLDLMQAYQAALAQDARIRAARAARDSAIERLPQAQAQLMPNIAINLGRNKNDIDRTQENALRQDIKFNEEYFSYNQTLQLRLPLFRMPLFAGLRQAGFVVDDAEATLERELQDLGSRVTGAYMEALLAQDGLDLVLKQKAVITTQLDAARKSLAAGFGTRTDIDEAQARLDMNIADELSARQHVEFTRRQLEILINQPVYGLATVDEKRLPLLPPEPADVAEWIRLAEASSPEVRAPTQPKPRFPRPAAGITPPSTRWRRSPRAAAKTSLRPAPATPITSLVCRSTFRCSPAAMSTAPCARPSPSRSVPKKTSKPPVAT